MISFDEFKKSYLEIALSNHSFEQKEKELLTYLRNSLQNLPKFPSNRFVDEKFSPQLHGFYHSYDNRTYSPPTSLPLCSVETSMISNTQCIGHSWLFKNDYSDGQPFISRLAPILLKRPDELDALWVGKLDGYYVCNDGNHRIYAAFLLNRPILVDCHSNYMPLVLDNE